MKNQENLRREHEAVRNKVGFYDFTHELYEVSGKSAASFLDKMFVNKVENMGVGTAVYTTMLTEEAIIIDDVIIFRLEDEKFWVSTLFIEAMKEWFSSYTGDFEDLNFKDLSQDMKMWAVQGPDSRDLLNDMLEEDISHLKFFQIEDNKLGDVDVKIARAGFTGELGYEIYAETKDEKRIVDALLEQGKKYSIVELKSDVVLTSLPGEKGYVIMDDLKGTNPLEVDFGWTVDWDSDFVGKEVLEKVKAEGAKRRLRGFSLADDAGAVAADDLVKVDGEEVGRVTKSFYGFTVEKALGYILIDTDHAKIGDKVTIATADGDVEATIEKRVFYDEDDKKVRQ